MDSYIATMGLEKFTIELDNVPQIYLPGKQVVGHVTLTTKSPLQFQIIVIHCQGEATTFRTKTKVKEGAPVNINYKGHDIIYSDETTLLTGPQTAASSEDPPPMELNPGTYNLPFYFTLPPSCPGSFEGSFGSIRYYLKASINNSTGTVMHMVKHPFTVINQTDLNFDKEAGRRFSTVTTVPMVKNGSVSCKLTMRKKGYVPGEFVRLKLDVNNNSAKIVNGFNCQLQQMVTYYGWKDNQDRVSNWEETRVVAQLTKKTKVAAHKTALVPWDLFKMPPVSPTLLEDSRLINVQYALLINSIDLDPNLSLYVPIIIGTIPLESAFDQLKAYRSQSLGALPTDSIPVALPLVPLTNDNKNLPVPHYMLTVYGSPDIRDQQDSILIGTPVPYTPLNVAYDWTPIAQELAQKRALEAALMEKENKKELKEKKSQKKVITKKNEYVVNAENPEEKRKSLFKSKKSKSPKIVPLSESLDKATQTDFESDCCDTDGHSADEL